MSLPEYLAHRARTLLTRKPRVAIALDGPDAAGKTTLADAIAASLGEFGTRLSADDFHQPAARRRARGLTAEAYLDDTFDIATLASSLRSFRAGDEHVVVGVHDLATDAPKVIRVSVPAVAALVVDGVFLLRDELADMWDEAIYVHVPEHVTMERAVRRDLDRFGGAEQVELRYRQKYLPGQALYRARNHPMRRADLVFDMTDPQRPRPLSSSGEPCEPT